MHIAWKVVATGITMPEGPAADSNGNVFLVSRKTGKVVKVDAAGRTSDVIDTGGKPQSVALLPSGDLLLADAKNQALQRITPDGRLLTVTDRVDGRPLLGPNDLVVGPDNVVYLTDPGLNFYAPGQVLRIELSTGAASVLIDGLLFPNGITISDDGRWLYVAESVPHRVWRYPLVDKGRRVGAGEVFHQFDDFYPDGIALDSTGRLLVAMSGGGALVVLSPDGKQEDVIPAGGHECTNCVFGGDDFQTLYMTEDDQEALLCMRWPVPGQRRFSRSCC